MLEKFEFEKERDGIDAEVAAIRLDDWRATNVRPDDFFGCGDLIAIDVCIGHGSYLPGLRARFAQRPE